MITLLTIASVPTWVISGDVDDSMEKLIDKHLDATDGIIQLRGPPGPTLTDLKEAIEATHAQGLGKVLFAHFWRNEQTITLYVKYVQKDHPLEMT